MQHRYSGDVGDFGIFGLLRAFSSGGFRVGVNWYLIADEAHNGDGRHVGYLSNPKYAGIDDELWLAFGGLVESGKRNVYELEAKGLIEGAVYYNALLAPPKAGFSRMLWHRSALEALRDADIVFLAPDNGLLPPSVKETSKRSVKYALKSEARDFYKSGHSVILYSHRTRQSSEEYRKKFDWILSDVCFDDSFLTSLTFNKGSVRDFILAIQPRHASMAKAAIKGLLEGAWKEHFSAFGFGQSV